MATANITISPVIAGVYIVLENNGLNTCQTMTTSSAGICSFTSLPAGNYSIYNVGIEPDACPPTKCGYPEGYSGTVDPRRVDITLTSSGVTNQTFRYDQAPPWTTLNGGNAPNYGIAVSPGGPLYYVNIATGAAPNVGTLNNNGFGYNMADGFIYGGFGRSDANRSTVALNYPNSYSLGQFVGDCDDRGYYYNGGGTSFTCINVNSYSPGYLRAVDPYNGFAEITSSPYSINLTLIGSAGPQGADFSYVPSINCLALPSTTGGVFLYSLTTTICYGIPVIGPPTFNVGSTMSDMKNLYITNSSQIYKYLLTTTVAYGTTISNTTWPNSGDGSRAVGAPVYYAQPIVRKSVDKTITTSGSFLTYTVTIVNAGIVNGTNSYFYDTIPDGTTFVPDTFSYNGSIIPSTTPNYFYIGTLPIGQLMTITFQAKIDSTTITSFKNYANVRTEFFDQATDLIFDQSFISNVVTTTVVDSSISTSKSVNANIGSLGDILSYTIVITNTGTIPAVNLRVIDTLPIGTSFVNGSLIANGATQPLATITPPSGFLYGTLAAAAVLTVGFNVNIVSIPSSYNLINYASSFYSGLTPYGNIKFTVDTNTVATKLSSAIVSNLNKSVSSNYSTIGDTVTYTIVGQNTGNLPAINCVYVDTLSSGLSFLPGTVTVNGVSTSEAPSNVNIGSILPGYYFTITFQCLII